MKNILYALLALFCIGVTACDNDDTVELASLNIIKSTVDFNAIGGEGYVMLENGSNELKVTSNMEWCSIKDVTSDKITFSVTQNNGITTRTATITLGLGATVKRVSITQMGLIVKYGSDTFYRCPENIAFSKTVNFTSTLSVSVSIDPNAQNWLSYASVEEGYVFTGTANDSGSPRLGKVTITSGSISSDYYFYQYGLSDLLGEYSGAVQLYSDYFGLDFAIPLEKNTRIIEKEGSSGKYMLELPMLDLLNATLEMEAIYQNGIFIITTPQQQDYRLSIGYGSIIAKASDGLYLRADIGVAPTILSNGEIALTYVSDVYPILGLFTGRVPTANNYTGNSIDFPVILMQKTAE